MERLTFEVHDGGMFVKESDVKTYILHDIALDYDLDIQITTDKISERREKMFKEKDAGKLKSIVPLLDDLIYEAGQYKEWIEQMTDANIDSEDEKRK